MICATAFAFSCSGSSREQVSAHIFTPRRVHEIIEQVLLHPFRQAEERCGSLPAALRELADAPSFARRRVQMPAA